MEGFIAMVVLTLILFIGVGATGYLVFGSSD
jgi:hypothetical protein